MRKAITGSAVAGPCSPAIVADKAGRRSAVLLPDVATKNATAFLAAMGLKPNQVDDLQKMPMDKVIAALRGPAGAAFGPVVDGKMLPTHPFDPTAPDVSASVPMLLGSTETEMAFFAGGPLFPYALDPLDDAGLKQNLKKFLRADYADTAKVIDVYKKVHKNISDIDVFMKATADVGVRAMVLTQADRKVAQAKAPAYVYYFFVALAGARRQDEVVSHAGHPVCFSPTWTRPRP